MGRSLDGPVAGRRGATLTLAVMAALAMLVVALPGTALAAGHAKKHAAHARRHYRIRRAGELDCNGYSVKQRSVHGAIACVDIRGIRGVANDNVWHSRFFDNGHYIGHDEPDMTFLSNTPGSGNSVTWTEQLPYDPSAMPTVGKPGSDVTHWFELSVAPWFSMAMCDSNSYPQLPCEPQSDFNAPNGARYPGAGSAFMEMQFYPPGFAPFSDAISCDNTHWCAALNIDSLECTIGFAHCNPACEEPVNFAYIQTDGVPAGPPAPQNADLQTFTPNSNTLLMNPGDRLVVHMGDENVPGQPGQKAFKVTIQDLTTGQTGYMQASAQNGFQNTSIVDCSGTPHNFQPEYNTAKKGNITPWAALQTNISTQYEIGHFVPCTSLSGLVSSSDPFYTTCNGPYESAGRANGDGTGTVEPTDAFCFPAGDTHGALNTAPDEVTGCTDAYTQNGDLDFDGTPYWADWPTTAIQPTATNPGSFVQAKPVTRGGQYSSFFMQTDLALSESSCTASGAGCTVPPDGPGHFYPYWTRVSNGPSCSIEFGNVSTGSTYGKDGQYGTDQSATLGYPEFEGPVLPNSTC
jgi:uncharacterized membrane protein